MITKSACYPKPKIWRVLLEYSYSFADIMLNMIEILFLQKFDVFFGLLFICSLAI